jgi:hypothetical protein
MTPREAHHNSHSRPLLPQGLRQNCDRTFSHRTLNVHVHVHEQPQVVMRKNATLDSGAASFSRVSLRFRQALRVDLQAYQEFLICHVRDAGDVHFVPSVSETGRIGA